ncbi:hypothetical protein DFH08DRAFT_945701 [Mycena albidolilacea]|uniref:Uncharacterized protein n=1 Tax=Mycena albidolilacea TaxID=1033008 RepID=A0AAD6YZR7_9AGAR|nr:hypothetical protein DFH08DRAFT_945701 [Mycena albidolilacea]
MSYSSSGYHHNNKNDRDSDGRRGTTGTHNTRPLQFHQQGGFNPPPQGIHTRFDVYSTGKETSATGSKCDRSRERNRREIHDNSRSNRDRDREEHDGRLRRSPELDRKSAEPSSKRPKREPTPDIPAFPGDFAMHPDDSIDELDVIEPHPPAKPQSSRRTPAVVDVDTESSRSRTPIAVEVGSSGSEVKLERRRSGLFGGLFQNPFASKPQEAPESSRLQDALEAASQAQAEAAHMAEELRKAQHKCRELQDEVQSLETSKQRADDEIQRAAGRKTELADLMLQCSQQLEHIDFANAEIHRLNQKNQEDMKRYEAKIDALALEKAAYRSQLKQLRASMDARPPKTGPKADDFSLDPFDNKLDQVSEAFVKSAVESLNDSLDDFVMALLEEAEELANRNSDSRATSPVRVGEMASKLLVALAKHSNVEERRGFLLDAQLHHDLVEELDKMFFSGDVVARVMDSRGAFALIFRDLTKREMASSNRSDYGDAYVQQQDLEDLSGPALRLDRDAFGVGIPVALKLYKEANQLSIIARRDVLSVRMLVVVAPTGPAGPTDYLPYDTNAVASVWPDMKTVEGDEVIALHKFGLEKVDEKGQLARLIKPEVATTALLREMAKNSTD